MTSTEWKMFYTQMLKRGYRAHTVPETKLASEFYQRIVKKNNSKLFFLNIYKYDPVYRIPSVGVMVEARFYLKKSRNQTGFDVTFHVEHESLNTIEAFFMKAYRVLYCQPDLHNQ